MSDAAPPPAATSPQTRADLLRRAAAARPLWLDVHGESMGTTITSGSSVRIEPAGAPRRGQIWAFCADDGRVLVHRYLGARGELVWLKGDANRDTDAPVHRVLLVGVVREIERDGRRRRVGRWRDVVGRIRLDVHASWQRVERITTMRTKVN
jgi:SOS-response transcriptional repressor LexA